MNYTIGQVSKALNISVQAIRLYQKKKLIEPTEVNDETGYRYFDEEEMGKIWRIKVLQSAGFQLSEIQALEELSLREIQDVFNEKRTQLNDEIKIKNMSLAYLDRQINAIDIFESDPKIEVKYIKTRYGHAFGLDERPTLYEHLSDLNNVQGDFGVNLEVSFQPSRRISLTVEDMTLKDLFAIYQDDREGASIQEAGLYICYHYKKGMKVKEIYKKLRAYAKENGYTLRGDAIELILINDNLVHQSKYNLFEIQIAVTKD